MTPELKPCPFCGGEWGLAQEPRDNHPVAGMWYLYHKSPRCVFDHSPPHFDTRYQALEAFNQRPGELRQHKALADIAALRLATDRGSLRERADRMWEIASAELEGSQPWNTRKATP